MNRKPLYTLIRISIFLNWLVAIFFAFHFAVTGNMYALKIPVNSLSIIFTCFLDGVIFLPYILNHIQNSTLNPEDNN